MSEQTPAVGMERKLTAILSADVKGYSRLMGEDEEATIRTLTVYRALIATHIQHHRGRVVDSPGDNLLAEFSSAVDAVQSAVAIQRELKVKNTDLLDANPFTKAARYALEREAALRVFLEYPNVPLDTNHLEREIRAIAMGRKAWLFCWTELGARYVGIVQSLVASCRLQGIDPYVYLVDVLQRVDTHPAFDVHLLTPRLWKQHFAKNPLRSDLDRLRQ